MRNQPAAQTAADRIEATTLRQANEVRQREWDEKDQITIEYRANEMAGEVGEALERAVDVILMGVATGRASNIAKKLARERLGIRGSRATKTDLAEELADVVISADLIAMKEGIDLDRAVQDKFNATSEKYGLKTFLARTTVADVERKHATEVKRLTQMIVHKSGIIAEYGEIEAERDALAAQLNEVRQKNDAAVNMLIKDQLALAKQLAEANEIVAKLPKTADGVVVVPGMKVWVRCGVDVYEDDCRWIDTEGFRDSVTFHASRSSPLVYSTREAALSTPPASTPEPATGAEVERPDMGPLDSRLEKAFNQLERMLICRGIDALADDDGHDEQARQPVAEQPATSAVVAGVPTMPPAAAGATLYFGEWVVIIHPKLIYACPKGKWDGKGCGSLSAFDIHGNGITGVVEFVSGKKPLSVVQKANLWKAIYNVVCFVTESRETT